MKSWLVAGLAGVCASSGFVWNPAEGQAAPRPPAVAGQGSTTAVLRQPAGPGTAPGQTGPYAVSWIASLVLQGGKGNANTALFYPSSSDTRPLTALAPAPVVVLLQGGAVPEEDYYFLGDQLASWGFVVAIPPHPRDFAVYAPQRSSAVLDTLAGLAQSDPLWLNYFELEQATVGGHSLGGVVADGAVETDPRFRQLTLLASYPGDTDGLSFTGNVLSVAGAQDCNATLAETTAGFESYGYPRAFAVLEGVTHYQFTASEAADLADCPPGVSLDLAHQRLGEALVSWLKVVVEQDDQFLPYLETPSAGISWRVEAQAP